MTDPRSESGIRLQKVLAQAGIGSRRACEELIEQGRVSVDGNVVRGQGLRVDPETAAIHVDGERVPTAADTVVMVLNKPRGVLTTMHDDLGRPCVGDYVAGRNERLFHVGRLDADTEGLLLLTNDGLLSQHITHPSHGVAKTYLATVPGPIARDVGRRLKAGIMIDDRVTPPHCEADDGVGWTPCGAPRSHSGRPGAAGSAAPRIYPRTLRSGPACAVYRCRAVTRR